MTRIYLPSTVAGLRRLRESRELALDPEPFVAAGEDEAAEYDALMSAADVSASLLDGPGRRVVVVAEVRDTTRPLGLLDVVAVHADTDERPADADPDEDLGWFGVQEIDALLS